MLTALRTTLWILLLASSSPAASVCVNPGGTGGCFASIQAAVNASSTGGTVSIAAGTYVENVVIGPPKSLRIEGAGAIATFLESAGGIAPVIQISPASRAIIERVTIQSGSTGVAVEERASADLSNVQILGNAPFGLDAKVRSRTKLRNFLVSGNGIGLHSQGAVLDVSDGRVSDNASDGIFSNIGRLKVSNVVVRDNGRYGISGEHVTISHAEVSDNAFTGLDVSPAAVFGGCSLRLDNTTVDGNGGGIWVGSRCSAIIEHATVTDNTTTFGLGCEKRCTVRASIFAGNAPADCAANATSLRVQGLSLFEDIASCVPIGTPPLIADPLLGPLQLNLGPSRTREPQPGSPVLGVATGGACRSTDQRGVARTSPCDLGAHESS